MELDSEAFGRIVRDFSLDQISRLCETSSEINSRICESDSFWQQRFLQDFGPLNYTPGSWKLEYQFFWKAKFVIKIYRDDQYIDVPTHPIRQISVNSSSTILLDFRGNLFSYAKKDAVSSIISLSNNIQQLIFPGNPIFYQIASGEKHHLALDTEGKVWGFGSNEYGQLGPGANNFPEFQRIYFPIDLEDQEKEQKEEEEEEEKEREEQEEDFPQIKIREIAAGKNHSLFLDINGKVWGCGSNQQSQLGYRSKNSSRKILPLIIQGNRVKFISSGTVYWKVKPIPEDPSEFVDTREYIVHPNQLIQTSEGLIHEKRVFASKIFAGKNSTFVKVQTQYWACGANDFGSLGIGQPFDPEAIKYEQEHLTKHLARNQGFVFEDLPFSTQTPELVSTKISKFQKVLLPDNINLVKIASSENTNWFLSEDGRIYHAGQYIGYGISSSKPINISDSFDQKIVDIALNEFTGFAVTFDRQLWINNLVGLTKTIRPPSDRNFIFQKIPYLYGIQKIECFQDRLYLLKIYFKIGQITPKLRDYLLARGEIFGKDNLYRDIFGRQMFVSESTTV